MDHLLVQLLQLHETLMHSVLFFFGSMAQCAQYDFSSLSSFIFLSESFEFKVGLDTGTQSRRLRIGF
jgi:hypothetical protein